MRRRPRSVDETKPHDAGLSAHLVWVLGELAEDRRASVPAVSGLSAVSVLWSGTRASPPLEAEMVNDTSVRRERTSVLMHTFCYWDATHTRAGMMSRQIGFLNQSGGTTPTGAVGVALTTWGGIPETGTAPLGGRFLLVTEAQENGCGTSQHRKKCLSHSALSK